MVEASHAIGQLKPLKITCTSSNCRKNLHCFRATKKMKQWGLEGTCRSCGARLVDWHRVHQRDFSDVTYTFNALKFEMIRHHFWHISLSPYAIRYALRKGRTDLSQAAERQIRRLVGPANPAFDGRQTPRETSAKANAIHYAQHATASCCRKCIEEWHGIPQGRALKHEEVFYLRELAMLYLCERVPGLFPLDKNLAVAESGVASTRLTSTMAHVN